MANLLNTVYKLQNNVFTFRALRTLGLVQYCRYLLIFLRSLPEIIKSKDFRPLDRAMGHSTSQFVFRNKRFAFDCNYCDQAIHEDSYAFGVAREIYIRDCYFSGHTPSTFNSAKNVLDIGANRGALSSLMTVVAEQILAIELSSSYRDTFIHNMRANHFDNYRLINGEVISGDILMEDNKRTSICEVLDLQRMQIVDFAKIDIEGAEYSLFKEAGWLDRVKALSMEVHPAHGDTMQILHTLGSHGFKFKTMDENLKITADPKSIAFVYAIRS